MREWDRLACRALALAPYASPSTALARLEPGDPSLEELARKNDILRALVGAVQQGGGAAAAASPVLWLALWRGLAQLVRRHAQFLRDPDEAVSEVTDRFSMVVHGLRLEHVGRIALTLLRSTQRELQVLRGMSQGKSNGQIGRELYLSEDTVKTHARRLFRKLGVRDRAQAVAHGFRRGLVQ